MQLIYSVYLAIERFGTVIIESASCGIPAIGTRIYGLKDAIEDGITGLLVGLKRLKASTMQWKGFAGS